MLIVLALKEESIILSEIRSFLSNFVSSPHFVSTYSQFALCRRCFTSLVFRCFFSILFRYQVFNLFPNHSSAFQLFVASFSLSIQSPMLSHRSQSSLCVTPLLDPSPTVSFKSFSNWRAFRWTFHWIVQRISLKQGSFGRHGVKRNFRIICHHGHSSIAKWFCRSSARFW